MKGPFIGLCFSLAACSDGAGPTGPRTVLLTNALASDYIVIAIDELTPVSTDTVGIIYVPAATQACLPLPGVRLTPANAVRLETFESPSGIQIGQTEVRPAQGSWAWDGVAANATHAPAC